jgi:hypothetical protein
VPFSLHSVTSSCLGLNSFLGALFLNILITCSLFSTQGQVSHECKQQERLQFCTC